MQKRFGSSSAQFFGLAVVCAVYLLGAKREKKSRNNIDNISYYDRDEIPTPKSMRRNLWLVLWLKKVFREMVKEQFFELFIHHLAWHEQRDME